MRRRESGKGFRAIKDILGPRSELDPAIRYQFLRRTAVAVLDATRCKASVAAMIVHSFSAERDWFDRFCRFADLFCGETGRDAATVGGCQTAEN